VVYTPWANLKKTAGMNVGQVGFHDGKEVLKFKVEKKKNETINRLNKTKTEEFPDLQAQREQRDHAERNKKKGEMKEQQEKEKKEADERRKHDEMMDYKNMMIEDNMVTNKGITKSVQEYEEDFM